MGSFTISDAPIDSQLELISQGYITVPGASQPGSNNRNLATVSTTYEGETVDLGNVMACALMAKDNISPYVSNVTGAYNQCTAASTPVGRNLNAGRVYELVKGTDGELVPFVVNFSEPVKADLSTGDDLKNYVMVRQYLSTGGTIQKTVESAALSANGMSLIVTMAEGQGIPQGEVHFDVILLDGPWKDVGGDNLLQIAGSGYRNDPGVNFLPVDRNDNVAQYGPNNAAAMIQLCSFKVISDATAGTLTQLRRDTLNVQQDNGALEVNSNVFADANDDSQQGATPNQNIQMLNTADDDDANNGTDAATRLGEVARVLLAGSTVRTDTARVQFVPGNASSYFVTVTDNQGSQVAGITYLVQSTNPTNTLVSYVSGDPLGTAQGAGAVTGFIVKGAEPDPVDLVVTGVKPKQFLNVTPVNNLGYAGSPSKIQLLDNVPPTTVMQRAYNAGDTITGVGSVNIGEGGELTYTSAGAGSPTLPITPHLLDNINAGGGVVGQGGVSQGDRNLSREIMVGNGAPTATDNAIATVVAPNSGFGTSASPHLSIYDATAWDKFNAASGNKDRQVGVAMSEDLNPLTGNPAFDGTTALSNWAIENDKTAQEWGTTGALVNENVDLVRFKADVMSLANNDHGKIINFDGVLQDLTGNTAGQDPDGAGFSVTNAKVVVRDEMPPFLTRAVYDGTNLVLTFNEPVTLGAASVILTNPVSGASATVRGWPATRKDATGNTVSTLSADKKTVTIPVTAAAVVGAVGGAFSNSRVYTETAYATTGLPHTVIDFKSVRDEKGNSWNDWLDSNGVAVATMACDDPANVNADACANTNTGMANSNEAPGAGVNALSFTIPRFAGVMNIPAFIVNSDNALYLNAQNSNTTDQTVTFKFNQPVQSFVNGAGVNLVSAAALDTTLEAPSNTVATTLNTFFNVGTGVGANNFTAAAFSWNASRDLLSIKFRTAVDTTGDDNGKIVKLSNVVVTSDTGLTELGGSGVAVSPK
jgi:hypothetical protein